MALMPTNTTPLSSSFKAATTTTTTTNSTLAVHPVADAARTEASTTTRDDYMEKKCGQLLRNRDGKFVVRLCTEQDVNLVADAMMRMMMTTTHDDRNSSSSKYNNQNSAMTTPIVLKEVTLSFCQTSLDHTPTKLLEALATCHIQSLVVSNLCNQPTGHGRSNAGKDNKNKSSSIWELLFRAVSQNPHLTSLKVVHGQGLNDSSLGLLMRSTKTLRSLELNLSHVQEGSDSMASIMDSFAQNSSLETVSLTGTSGGGTVGSRRRSSSLSSSSSCRLINALGCVSSLQSLYVVNPPLPVCRAIRSLLSCPTTQLRELNLPLFVSGSSIMAAISAASVSSSSKLMEKMQHYHGDARLEEIIHGLMQNNTVQSFRGIQVGSMKTAQQLRALLCSQTTTLKDVEMTIAATAAPPLTTNTNEGGGSSDQKDAILGEILHGMKLNQSVKRLRLVCSLDTTAAAATLPRHEENLHRLNTTTHEPSSILTEMLQHNQTLEELDLVIPFHYFDQVTAGLRANSSIRALGLTLKEDDTTTTHGDDDDDDDDDHNLVDNNLGNLHNAADAQHRRRFHHNGRHDDNDAAIQPPSAAAAVDTQVYCKYMGALVEALRASPNITSLSLVGGGSNYLLGDASAITLARYLSEENSDSSSSSSSGRCHLVNLQLHLKDMGDAGLVALVQALKTNHSLKTLWLPRNRFGIHAIRALTDAVPQLHVLERLTVGLKGAIVNGGGGSNNDDKDIDHALHELIHSFERNTHLTEISVDDMYLDRNVLARVCLRNQCLRLVQEDHYSRALWPVLFETLLPRSPSQQQQHAAHQQFLSQKSKTMIIQNNVVSVGCNVVYSTLQKHLFGSS